ncbi:MAG: hypothetical protein ACTSUE_25265 [Promethearchaeota archaeon]
MEEYSVDDSLLYFGMWKSVWRKSENRVKQEDKELPWMIRKRDERVPFARVERREGEDVLREMAIALVNFIKVELSFHKGKVIQSDASAAFKTAKEATTPVIDLIMTPRKKWTLDPAARGAFTRNFDSFVGEVAEASRERFSVAPAVVYEGSMKTFEKFGQDIGEWFGMVSEGFAKSLVSTRIVQREKAIVHLQKLFFTFTLSIRHLINSLYLHGYIGNATSEAVMRCIGAAASIGRVLDDYGIAGRKD